MCAYVCVHACEVCASARVNMCAYICVNVSQSVLQPVCVRFCAVQSPVILICLFAHALSYQSEEDVLEWRGSLKTG
jgi:hypothetical protein